MPARSQGTSYLSNTLQLGSVPTSSTSTAQWTLLDPVAGSKYVTPGLTHQDRGVGPIVQSVFTFSDTPLILADAAGVVAHGYLDLYDFPAGHILFLGAVTDLDVTKTSAGVNATWDGDIGVGTGAEDGTVGPLDSTMINIIPNTATPQSVAGVTTADAVSTATENAPVDGTATALSLFLNMLVDDADHDVTTTPCNLILNGTLTVTWINLGDN